MQYYDHMLASWVKKNTEYLFQATFAIALLSMLISLSLSEVFHFTPCVLCWYQRICMYPLVVFLGVAIWRKNKDIHLYILPLAIVGWLIAGFHTLLQWKIIPDALAPCQAGISCTTKFINFFGFVTIPFLSFVSFSGILLLMLAYWRYGSE